MKKRSFKAPVAATTSGSTTKNDGIDNRGGGGNGENNNKNMSEKRTNSSKKTISTGITALQEINSTASLSADGENNSKLETKKSKTQREKELNAKSMTDADYEELFDAVLRESLIEECCRKTTRTESNVHNGRSPKEYASLRPVAADEGPKAVDDSACDADGPPEEERAATDNVTPSKAREVLAWRAVSPIADMKESNKRRLSAEKAKSTGAKAGFSLGNFRKGKENCKPRKSKGDGSDGKPPSSKKRKVQEERQEEVESWSLTQECTKGVWVQCANDSCCKWRHLDYIHDPSKFISVRWTCADNEDKYHNSCDAPVEHWDENADWTYNRYTEGSLVWARVDGYPWWPAMIEIDPDMEAFVFCYDHSTYTPVEYHVTFFDSEKATRAWLLPKHIKPFVADKVDQEISTKIGNKRLMHAVKQAQECSQLSLAQRLRTFSFTIRYDGKIVGNKAKGATNYLRSTSNRQAHKSKSSRQAETIKPGRKPRSEKKKATPTSAVGSSETPRMKTTETPAATKTTGGDAGDALTDATCLALLPAPSDKPASAVTSRQHSPADGSRQHSPADGSRQHTPTGGSRQHTPTGGSRQHTPTGGSRQHTPTGGIMQHTPTGGIRQHTPTGGSQQPSSTLPANENELSEKLDFEKELDEIEGILSQSLMSQSQKSSSLSPAPGRNFPLTSSGSRDNSQSNRGTNSQSGDSQSQTGESQPSHSQSQSQRTSTPSPHRMKAGGPQKKMKKGFKCPAISPSSSQSGGKSDSKTTVSKPAPVNLANNSLFTQELSTGAATTQQSTVFDQGLRLTGNSVFTQELSGKDPFISGSTNPFTKAADLAYGQEDAPADGGQLKLSGNSLYTQELSAKDPFTTASKVTVTEKKGLDNSIFTQELSNKPAYASDLESEESIASHKMRDVNPLDIVPEC